ncbi:hypothetical protein BDV30DRAFT_220145 [Aspergillus minisclerotigenes]|uniref:Uncharacterized protein n=1 Tax=Aspergillus minisclerotigenes TaxID=656917 RepID=A0A5N6IM40_9EURO|nr:hypothetical protein BDV30DRAFT_220145 [Aspergillus minisclerotigenes]
MHILPAFACQLRIVIFRTLPPPGQGRNDWRTSDALQGLVEGEPLVSSINQCLGAYNDPNIYWLFYRPERPDLCHIEPL